MSSSLRKSRRRRKSDLIPYLFFLCPIVAMTFLKRKCLDTKAKLIFKFPVSFFFPFGVFNEDEEETKISYKITLFPLNQKNLIIIKKKLFSIGSSNNIQYTKTHAPVNSLNVHKKEKYMYNNFTNTEKNKRITQSYFLPLLSHNSSQHGSSLVSKCVSSKHGFLWKEKEIV